MAKTSSIYRDKKRRKMVKQFEGRRTKLKTIIMDKSLPIEERFEAQLKLAALPRNGAKTRVRNRCWFSGRSRAVYRRFGLSRLALREFGSDGLLPGLVKSSW
jgi:small subunit ribosomal protein S14